MRPVSLNDIFASCEMLLELLKPSDVMRVMKYLVILPIVNSGSVCMSTIGWKWLLHGQVLFCIPVVI